MVDGECTGQLSTTMLERHTSCKLLLNRCRIPIPNFELTMGVQLDLYTNSDSSMNHDSDSSFLESSLFRIMTLLATLTTAADVKHGIEERKAGRDPSDQEDERVVWPYLRTGEEELRTTLVQLRASFLFAQADQEGLMAVSVRRFSDLTRFHLLCGLLQRIHQRLLSLYPLISEELAEEARVLHVQSLSIADIEEAEYYRTASQFVNRALLFCDWLLGEIDATFPYR